MGWICSDAGCLSIGGADAVGFNLVPLYWIGGLILAALAVLFVFGVLVRLLRGHRDLALLDRWVKQNRFDDREHGSYSRSGLGGRWRRDRS